MTKHLSFRMVRGADLTAQERLPVLQLCSRAYGFDFEPFLATFHDATHVLGYHDRVLVSHALWVPRWLQCNGRPPMRTAYVEAVATEEPYWGRGFASAIMRKLALAITGFDLGALSPARFSLYQRLGWQLWRGPLFIRTAHGLQPTPDDEVMVLRLPRTPPLDLDEPLSAEWHEGELW